MDESVLRAACTPPHVNIVDFNPSANLPFGLTVQHVCDAMNAFVDFLGFVNLHLHTKGIERLEMLMMQANFSSLVGEFMVSSIPKFCHTLVKNRYHNGHPDLIPFSRFVGDAVQHANEGIEVKASRYTRGWQGHNAEDIWLMVFMFECNNPTDVFKGTSPKPFRFVRVVGAELVQSDWKFSGRSETSRRTITASVTPSGYQKLMANWIYEEPIQGNVQPTGRKRRASTDHRDDAGE